MPGSANSAAQQQQWLTLEKRKKKKKSCFVSPTHSQTTRAVKEERSEHRTTVPQASPSLTKRKATASAAKRSALAEATLYF